MVVIWAKASKYFDKLIVTCGAIYGTAHEFKSL